MRIKRPRTWLHAAWLLMVLFVGFAGKVAWGQENLSLEEPQGPTGKITSNGSFYVTWTSDPFPVPLNEMFEIRFRVALASDREKLIPGAVVTAMAFMPAHNHGTTLQPQVESHGDGTATARGLLLQMEGHWELRVGVVVDGQMERATFDIQLEP